MKNSGGKRSGAGRKALDYDFKVIQVRVPIELEQEAKLLIKKLREEWLRNQ